MKIYNVIYDNGFSKHVSKLTEDILQNLEDGCCDVFDITNPKVHLQLIFKTA